MDPTTPIQQLLHQIITADLGDLVQRYVNSHTPKATFVHDLVTHLKDLETHLDMHLSHYIRAVQFEIAQPIYDQCLLLKTGLTTVLESIRALSSPQEQEFQKDDTSMENPTKKKPIKETVRTQVAEIEASLLYSAFDTKEVES